MYIYVFIRGVVITSRLWILTSFFFLFFLRDQKRNMILLVEHCYCLRKLQETIIQSQALYIDDNLVIGISRMCAFISTNDQLWMLISKVRENVLNLLLICHCMNINFLVFFLFFFKVLLFLCLLCSHESVFQYMSPGACGSSVVQVKGWFWSLALLGPSCLFLFLFFS